jgi:toxin ParE1/3/4
MARLIWSPRAISDLDAVCEYVSRNSEAAARDLARQLIALAESIPSQPFFGPAVEEYGRDEIRERLCHNYRLIYRVQADNVEVAAILHGARRLPRKPPV